jgi:hypothetical protein
MGGGTGQPATGTTPTPTASSLPTWASSMASSVAPNLGFPSPRWPHREAYGGSLASGPAGAGNTAAGFQNVPLLSGADVPHIGTKKAAPAAVEAPAPAPHAGPGPGAPSTDQVLVYTQPSWGYQSDWRNGGDQFNDAGVYSKTGPIVDPKVWDTFGAGWGAP